MPDGVAAAPGDYVLVPLGTRDVPGMVWGEGGGQVDDARLREVIRRFDVPPLPAVGRTFIDWVGGYVMSPPGAVLRMTMSAPAALDPPRPVISEVEAAIAEAAGALWELRLRCPRHNNKNQKQGKNTAA